MKCTYLDSPKGWNSTDLKGNSAARKVFFFIVLNETLAKNQTFAEKSKLIASAVLELFAFEVFAMTSHGSSGRFYYEKGPYQGSSFEICNQGDKIQWTISYVKSGEDSENRCLDF